MLLIYLLFGTYDYVRVAFWSYEQTVIKSLPILT